MAPPKIRGVQTDVTKTALPSMTRDRDVRPLSEKIVSNLHQKGFAVFMMCIGTTFAMFVPSFALYIFVIGALFTWWALTRPELSPIKIPVQENIIDRNELHPANRKPTPGKGIFFIGNDINSGKEVWVTNDDCRQHFLVMGTTGAGKAIRLNERVHTPQGWRKASEIKLGDSLTTPFGSKSSKVVGIYPQGKRKMWTITFSDNRKAVVDGEHLWEVGVGFEGAGSNTVMTTKDIAEVVGKNRVSVITPDPVENPAIKYVVSPYNQGVQCANDGKRITDSYINGSIGQRYDILNGVLDLIGKFDVDNGNIVATTESEELALSLQKLSWSLGAVALVMNINGVFVVDMTFQDPSKAFSENHIKSSGIVFPETLRTVDNRIVSVEESGYEEEAVCFKIDDDRELFIIDDYLVTHNTELLLSFSSNALSWGSGFLYVDGKADRSLYAKILVMCRRWGRDDDLLVLNFMTGDNSVMDVGGNGTVNTNTMNPFANGSPDALVQLVTSLMGGGGGDNQMWVDRAQSMFTGMMYALVWLRDAKGKPLGVGDIRDHLQLGKIITLVDKNIYPDMPEHITKAIKAYLSSLPGWDNEKPNLKDNLQGRESEQITKQHGFLEMQFTKIFSSLVDVYSSIFNTAHGEIDVYDVVLNRRILVVMLPALEKADNELASLGKIIVASMKGMMGSVLGSNLEGGWDELVENRPTSSPSPFIVIFDEVGYYTVSGMAVMAAQGRSLGFSLVFASQDLNSLKRNEEKEAESIIGNTNLKMLMRTEDKATKELGIEAGGKGEKIQIDGYSMEDSDGWDSTKSAKANMEEVINGSDLKGQEAGYLHLIYKDKTVRARSFYADAPSSLDLSKVKLRPNHFLVVERGDLSEVDGLQRQPMLISLLSSPDFAEQMDDLAKYETELLEEKSDTLPDAAVIECIINRVHYARQQKKPVQESMGAAISVLKLIAKATIKTQRAEFSSAFVRGGRKTGFNNNDVESISDSVDVYDFSETSLSQESKNDKSPSLVVNGVSHNLLDNREYTQNESEAVSKHISPKKNRANDINDNNIIDDMMDFERDSLDNEVEESKSALKKESEAIDMFEEATTGEIGNSSEISSDIIDAISGDDSVNSIEELDIDHISDADDIENHVFDEPPEVEEKKETDEDNSSDSSDGGSDNSSSKLTEFHKIDDDKTESAGEKGDDETKQGDKREEKGEIIEEKIEEPSEKMSLDDMDVSEKEEERGIMDMSGEEFEDDNVIKVENDSLDNLDVSDDSGEFDEDVKQGEEEKEKKEKTNKNDKKPSESDSKKKKSDSDGDGAEDMLDGLM